MDVFQQAVSFGEPSKFKKDVFNYKRGNRKWENLQLF